MFVFLNSGIKSSLTLKTRVTYKPAADRLVGVFAATLMAWKHFYARLKFQSRSLEDPGEETLEPESESSSENWVDISTETMCSVTTEHQEPCTAYAG